MKLLVVEDSDSIRKLIETLMTSRGHAVTAVATGVKAIELALSESFDVILLDLHLPGAFDGFAVCERLRGEDKTRETPILVISAMSDDASKDRAKLLGATAYFTKPFSSIALLKAIEGLRLRT